MNEMIKYDEFGYRDMGNGWYVNKNNEPWDLNTPYEVWKAIQTVKKYANELKNDFSDAHEMILTADEIQQNKKQINYCIKKLDKIEEFIEDAANDRTWI